MVRSMDVLPPFAAAAASLQSPAYHPHTNQPSAPPHPLSFVWQHQLVSYNEPANSQYGVQFLGRYEEVGDAVSNNRFSHGQDADARKVVVVCGGVRWWLFSCHLVSVAKLVPNLEFRQVADVLSHFDEANQAT